MPLPMVDLDVEKLELGIVLGYMLSLVWISSSSRPSLSGILQL